VVASSGPRPGSGGIGAVMVGIVDRCLMRAHRASTPRTRLREGDQHDTAYQPTENLYTYQRGAIAAVKWPNIYGDKP
jgi:hypothetical protein